MDVVVVVVVLKIFLCISFKQKLLLVLAIKFVTFLGDLL